MILCNYEQNIVFGLDIKNQIEIDYATNDDIIILMY